MHERTQAPIPPNPATDDHRSESDFLAAQAAQAQAALARTWARMQDDLKNTADIPAWTRKYPWPAIGIAVATGFFGMAALNAVKKPARTENSDLAAALREAMNGAKQYAPPPHEPPVRPSLVSMLLSEVIRGLAGVLQGALASAFTPAEKQPTPPPSTNGTSHASDPPHGAA